MEETYGDEFSGASVERSIDLDSPASTVWRHLTEGDLVSDWMGETVDMDPKVGGRITMSPDDEEPVWGTIEVVDPERRLQWSWRTDEGMPSVVEIEITPGQGGSRVTVRETLLPWTVTGPDHGMTQLLAA